MGEGEEREQRETEREREREREGERESRSLILHAQGSPTRIHVRQIHTRVSTLPHVGSQTNHRTRTHRRTSGTGI